MNMSKRTIEIDRKGDKVVYVYSPFLPVSWAETGVERHAVAAQNDRRKTASSGWSSRVQRLVSYSYVVMTTRARKRPRLRHIQVHPSDQDPVQAMIRIGRAKEWFTPIAVTLSSFHAPQSHRRSWARRPEQA